jgi:hypothetical protein
LQIVTRPKRRETRRISDDDPGREGGGGDDDDGRSREDSKRILKSGPAIIFGYLDMN